MSPRTLAALLLALLLPQAAGAVPLQGVPPLPPGQYTRDLTRRLSPATLAAVEQLAAGVDQAGTGRFVVVVVDGTGDVPARDFAVSLFRSWRIGRPERGDGALLFFSLDRRAAEIVLGEGVDSPADVQGSQELMKVDIVPPLSRGDLDAAVLAGARGLVRLLQASPLNRTPVLSQGQGSPADTPGAAAPGQPGPGAAALTPAVAVASGLAVLLLLAGGLVVVWRKRRAPG